MSSCRGAGARTVGAGYVEALLREDADALALYQDSFDPAELLAGINTQILVLARRVAVQQSMSLIELANNLLEAASMRDQVGP